VSWLNILDFTTYTDINIKRRIKPASRYRGGPSFNSDIKRIISDINNIENIRVKKTVPRAIRFLYRYGPFLNLFVAFRPDLLCRFEIR